MHDSSDVLNRCRSRSGLAPRKRSSKPVLCGISGARQSRSKTKSQATLMPAPARRRLGMAPRGRHCCLNLLTTLVILQGHSFLLWAVSSRFSPRIAVTASSPLRCQFEIRCPASALVDSNGLHCTMRQHTGLRQLAMPTTGFTPWPNGPARPWTVVHTRSHWGRASACASAGLAASRVQPKCATLPPCASAWPTQRDHCSSTAKRIGTGCVSRCCLRLPHD